MAERNADRFGHEGFCLCYRGLFYVLQLSLLGWACLCLECQASTGVGIMKASERLTVVIKLGAGDLSENAAGTLTH